VFELPGNSVLVDKANVPELGESFVMKVSKLEVAHRNDDGGWMTGSIKKHKPTKRTDSAGKNYVAKIELQFTNPTQSANFRLLKEDYGPAEEWVLFQAKPKPGLRDAPEKPGARGAPKKSFKSKFAKKNKM
jgi:hypothetical protein